MTQLRELYGKRLDDPRVVLELTIALGAGRAEGRQRSVGPLVQGGRMTVDLAAAADFLAGSARLLDRRRFDVLFDGGERRAAARGRRRLPQPRRRLRLGPGARPALTHQPARRGAARLRGRSPTSRPATTPRAVELCDWLAARHAARRRAALRAAGARSGRLRAVLGVGGQQPLLAADHRDRRGRRPPGGRGRSGGRRSPVARPGHGVLPDAPLGRHRHRSARHGAGLRGAAGSTPRPLAPRAPPTCSTGCGRCVPADGVLHVDGGADDEFMRPLDFAPSPGGPARTLFAAGVVEAELSAAGRGPAARRRLVGRLRQLLARRDARVARLPDRRRPCFSSATDGVALTLTPHATPAVQPPYRPTGRRSDRDGHSKPNPRRTPCSTPPPTTHGSRERIGPRPFIRTPVPDLDGLPGALSLPAVSAARRAAPSAGRDGARPACGGSRSGRSEDRDQEVRVRRERPQVPGGQQQVRRPARVRGVGEEVVERVAAVGAEADGRPSVVGARAPAGGAAPRRASTARGTSSRCRRTRSRRTARERPPAGRSSSARSPTSQRAAGCSFSASAISTGSTSTPTTSWPTDGEVSADAARAAAGVQHARARGRSIASTSRASPTRSIPCAARSRNRWM